MLWAKTELIATKDYLPLMSNPIAKDLRMSQTPKILRNRVAGRWNRIRKCETLELFTVLRRGFPACLKDVIDKDILDKEDTDELLRMMKLQDDILMELQIRMTERQK